MIPAAGVIGPPAARAAPVQLAGLTRSSRNAVSPARARARGVRMPESPKARNLTIKNPIRPRASHTQANVRAHLHVEAPTRLHVRELSALTRARTSVRVKIAGARSARIRRVAIARNTIGRTGRRASAAMLGPLHGSRKKSLVTSGPTRRAKIVERSAPTRRAAKVFARTASGHETIVPTVQGRRVMACVRNGTENSILTRDSREGAIGMNAARASNLATGRIAVQI